jgi:regulator of protease activity HflC (stomatin/prohibitin superfamily)
MNSLVLGALVGAAIVAIYAVIRAGFRVDNGNLAVLAVFGRFVRAGGGKVKTFGPGLHWRWPWAQVITVSLAERSLGLGAAAKTTANAHGAPATGTSSASTASAAMEALAADGTRIRINARLRYRIDPARVDTYLADAKDALDLLAGLFRLAVREQVARFEQRPEELAAYTALRLRMNELQLRIQASLEATARDYGVTVIAVDLIQIDPPEELIDALNAVITAESEANALVARTDLQCQQRVLSSEQAIAIAQARALATESEIRTVGNELGTLADGGVLRDYIDRRRIELLGGSHRVYINHQPTTLRS